MIDLRNIYNIDKNEKVFLDTNVLILLFSPYTIAQSQEADKEKFSKIFQKLIEQECTIYINSHVVSEFINQSLRLDFNRNFNIDGKKDFKKDYRKSESYTVTINTLLKVLKNVYKLINIINDDFESVDTLSLYKENKNIDFNDLIIVDTAVRNNLKILTNDSDMDGYRDIDINWYI